MKQAIDSVEFNRTRYSFDSGTKVVGGDEVKVEDNLAVRQIDRHLATNKIMEQNMRVSQNENCYVNNRKVFGNLRKHL